MMPRRALLTRPSGELKRCRFDMVISYVCVCMKGGMRDGELQWNSRDGHEVQGDPKYMKKLHLKQDIVNSVFRFRFFSILTDRHRIARDL